MQTSPNQYPPVPDRPAPTDLIGRVSYLEQQLTDTINSHVNALDHLGQRIQFLERQIGTSLENSQSPAMTKAPGY